MEKMDIINSDGDVTPEPQDLKKVLVDKHLREFTFRRVLTDNRERKFIVVEGTFKYQPGTALLLLEKESFPLEHLPKLFVEKNEIEASFNNDIYWGFRYLPKEVFNGVKLSVIYPATEKHIQKFESHPPHIIQETPRLYKKVTLPYLKSEQLSLQWLYNILEHKSEVDRIIFEDRDPETGFILCPDIKWDGKTTETLYILGIPFKKGIMTLRDLSQRHVPLLKKIYDKGREVIEKKYSIPSSQIRVYIHYLPSFFHLHIHFNYLPYGAPGSHTEKAHLLTTVINNLELLSTYYKVSRLDFVIKENSALFAKYENLGLVKRLPKQD